MESKFLTHLDVEALDDKLWRLTSELQYQSKIFNDIIKAPVGFVTDFASVPRVPIVYEAFGDRAHHESAIHDFLYQTHLTTKHNSDRIFLEAMAVRGKPIWVRYGMYWGVVIGGAGAYKTGLQRFKVLGNKQEIK